MNHRKEVDKMDRDRVEGVEGQKSVNANRAAATRTAANKYAWVPSAMPGVARLMKEKRAKFGDRHVTECWNRSMAGEAGWLFAREGALAIGTPWPSADVDLANFAAANVTATQALLLIREP